MHETTAQPETLLEPPAAPLRPERTLGRRRLPTVVELNMLTELSNRLSGCGVNGAHAPAAVFAKLLVGWEHGLDPGVSLNDLKLIDGRLTLPEMVAVAAIRGSGVGDIRTVEVAADHATVEVTRADWLPGRRELVTHTRADALAAGLVLFDPQGRNISKKDNWRRSEGPMHLARARGDAKRRYFEEEAAGLAYSPDELGAETDEDGRLLEPVQLITSPLAVSTKTPAVIVPANDLAMPFGEPASPPEQTAIRTTATRSTVPEPSLPPDPTAKLTVASPSPAVPTNADNPLLAEAVARVVALKLTKEQWQSVVVRVGAEGPISLALLTEPAQRRVVAFVTTLWRIDQLRNIANLDDATWNAALTRRGVTQAIDLKPEDAQTIYHKLADLVTPFDRERLGTANGSPEMEVSLAGKPSMPSSEPESAGAGFAPSPTMQ